MVAKIMMALGLIATMAAATATPSLAQGVYFEGPGFGVGVGPPRTTSQSHRYQRTAVLCALLFGTLIAS